MKPLSLKVEETTKELAEVINNSDLPAYCLKQILKDLFIQLENIEQEEIKKYQEELSKEKESDK